MNSPNEQQPVWKTRIDKLETRFDEMQHRHEGVEQRFDSLETQVGSLADSMESLVMMLQNRDQYTVEDQPVGVLTGSGCTE